MKKQYIRQRQFSKRSSAGKPNNTPGVGFGYLSVELLDRVSCFETMRAYHGKVFQCREHLGRLSDSCKAIGRSLDARWSDEIEVWVKASLKACGLKDALLRVSAHFDRESEDQGRFVIFLRGFKAHPSEWYEKGVALKTTARRRWDFKAQDPQIKASQFMNGVLAVLDESGSKAHEHLFFGPRGTVAEGSVSNVFIVRDKQLLTPAVSSGILRGVTRAVVVDLAKKIGLKVLETLLTRHELYTAHECFMTNTSSEVLPVTSIDGRRIGAGVPGLMTKRLAKEFKKIIR